MVRDVPRDRLPNDAVWNMVDWIPSQLGAPLTKRGGYPYESQDLTTILAGAEYVEQVVYVPFAAGAQLVAVAGDLGGATPAKLAQIVSSSSTTDRNVVNVRVRQPTFYRELLILPDAEGGGVVQKYGGSGDVATLGGTPPVAGFATVYKDHLVLGYSIAEPPRVWFAEAGNPESWDTTAGWQDTSAPVSGLWALRNAILVFHRSWIDRIRGDIPPGFDAADDLRLDEHTFDVGAPDARSIAGTNDYVCFAGPSGAFLTDGVELIDLTDKGGMQSYWQDTVATNGTTGYHAGIYRDYYIVSLGDGLTHHDTLMCHIPTRAWSRLSNIDAACFGRRLSGNEELYWGRLGAARVGSFSDLFDPTAANKNDADGDAVTPVLETGFYRGRQGLKRFLNAFVDYDLRDAATDNPTLTLSYITEPEATSYTAVTKLDGSAYTLAETSRSERVRRKLNEQTDGIALKLAQTNASSVTKLYELEATVRPLEGSRLRAVL
jgi:hypothetical protein